MNSAYSRNKEDRSEKYELDSSKAKRICLKPAWQAVLRIRNDFFRIRIRLLRTFRLRLRLRLRIRILFRILHELCCGVSTPPGAVQASQGVDTYLHVQLRPLWCMHLPEQHLILFSLQVQVQLMPLWCGKNEVDRQS